MFIFVFVWRNEEGGDFYQQGFAAATLDKAKRRWRHYTGRRIRVCVSFEHTETVPY